MTDTSVQSPSTKTLDTRAAVTRLPGSVESAAPNQKGFDTNSQVLLTTVPSDAHMWNLVFLQLLLEESGCKVYNLGQCTPVNFICETALGLRPDVIVVSSVNGHGHIDGLTLVTELRKHPELAHTKIIIGGKLGISGTANLDHAAQLIEAGFDAVFEASSDPSASTRLLDVVTSSGRAALIGGQR